MGLFNRKINKGLTKTRDKFSSNIDNVLDAFDEIGDELYDELTEVLIMGDVGVSTSAFIVDEVKDRVGKKGIKHPTEVRTVIKEVVADMLGEDQKIDFVTTPAIILVVGVNGVGKTTTIGKMAHYFKEQDKKVILGAADTFRAAAIDQLEVWAERAGVEIVKHKEGADPAAVVFDTINAGINRNADVIIIDTAGRLHNKKHLMDELNKIFRVIDRELPYSDREIFLVLDATTGQNAVSQAKEFMGVTEVSGIVLTKLDGTARGGVVLSITNDLKLPVKFIGVGEGLDDLQPFSAETFAASLFDVEAPEDASNYEPIITVNEERLARDKAEAAAREVARQQAEEEAAEKARLEAEAAAAELESQNLPADDFDESDIVEESSDSVTFEEKEEEAIVIEDEHEEIVEETIEEPEIIEEELADESEEPVEEIVEEPVEEEPKEEKKAEEPKKKKGFFSGLFSGSGEYEG
ncbi:MAG: signal recognition particle-docking protein FtsY [Oscillospiraceae bacterium]|nr:signal recognition particle-docking protein FtsY [Candidatus Limimonas egerieequi]